MCRMCWANAPPFFFAPLILTHRRFWRGLHPFCPRMFIFALRCRRCKGYPSVSTSFLHPSYRICRSQTHSHHDIFAYTEFTALSGFIPAHSLTPTSSSSWLRRTCGGRLGRIPHAWVLLNINSHSISIAHYRPIVFNELLNGVNELSIIELFMRGIGVNAINNSLFLKMTFRPSPNSWRGFWWFPLSIIHYPWWVLKSIIGADSAKIFFKYHGWINWEEKEKGVTSLEMSHILHIPRSVFFILYSVNQPHKRHRDTDYWEKTLLNKGPLK